MTGNFIIVTLIHMLKMINKAIVRDIRHLDNAINLACPEGLEGIGRHAGRLHQEFHFVSSVGHVAVVLASGFRNDVHFVPKSSMKKRRNCTFLAQYR